MYHLFNKFPNISTVCSLRILSFSWPTVLPFSEKPRSPGPAVPVAMDEAQAVLKASDDEAKRICQEIRRIGGTDRALGKEIYVGKMDESHGFLRDLRDLSIYLEIDGENHVDFCGLFVVCLRDKYLEIHGKTWGWWFYSHGRVWLEQKPKKK